MNNEIYPRLLAGLPREHAAWSQSDGVRRGSRIFTFVESLRNGDDVLGMPLEQGMMSNDWVSSEFLWNRG